MTPTISDELLTQIATLTAPTATEQPTIAFTLVLPTPTPSTPTLGPTLDVSPLFITQDAPSVVISGVTPLPATTTPQGAATPTASLAPPTPTLLPVNPVPPRLIQVPPAPGLPGTLSYALSAGSGIIRAEPFSIRQNPTLFAQNPANPNQYIAVDGAGVIFFVRDYAGNNVDRVRLDIFTDHHYNVRSREENDAAVSDVAWSADGRLAFIVDGDRVNKDGVWVWQPDGPGYQVLRDCPPAGGCETVRDTSGLTQWESVDAAWSPQGDALLVRLYVQVAFVAGQVEERYAYVVADPSQANAERVPGPVCYFDYANWSEDGQRLVVGGRSASGNIVLGSVNRVCEAPILTDMGALGWSVVRDPTQYNGYIYALAARDPSRPVQLVDEAGIPMTEPIGNVAPERVAWSPERGSVLVVTNEGGFRRYYVAHVTSRTVQEITQQVLDAQTVQWVSGTIVTEDETTTDPQIAPTAAGFDLQAGSRAVVLRAVNTREGPTLGAQVIVLLQPGEEVAILDGPVYAEGFPWYQVQLPDGQVGWLAAAVYGNRMVRELEE